MKMRGNPELVAPRNVYCWAGILILISSFAGCAAGSCLSYGHSCWGAHGKRSGVVRPVDSLMPSDLSLKHPAAGQRVVSPSFGERWLLSRLVNRQLMQVPLRGRMLTQPLGDELPEVTSLAKHSLPLDKLSGSVDVRDLAKEEQRISEGEESHILPYPQSKDFPNDDEHAIKMGFYKLLKNFDEKLK
ncbi:uncharacterized protein LOC100679516 isoform X2 [Nasonia vitripennis]|uniref:Uncharacterized protein n=1 Tax=Nasonia vitripennis TaxID=7425 RepID=A0A7M7IU00_NASVI|nr:uncharacterized protein LOC100679516 isoform X2 [Nasonia vitripennis]